MINGLLRTAFLLPMLAMVPACSSSSSDTPVTAAKRDTLSFETPATFTGSLPCADCPGIDVTLTLLGDGTFRLREAYRDTTTIQHALGRWSVEENDRLTLYGGAEPRLFRIAAPDSLELLDKNGAVLSPQVPRTLSRAAQIDRIRDMMPMRGTYATEADAGRFTECRSGAVFPVAPLGAQAQLEYAYAEARRDPGVPLLVDFMGHFEDATALSGDRQVEQVVIDVFQRVERDATCDDPSPLAPKK